MLARGAFSRTWPTCWFPDCSWRVSDPVRHGHRAERAGSENLVTRAVTDQRDAGWKNIAAAHLLELLPEALS
ncbi:hypothetical protein AOLI_G00251110 [Acnodon oligacanthus]